MKQLQIRFNFDPVKVSLGNIVTELGKLGIKEGDIKWNYVREPKEKES